MAFSGDWESILEFSQDQAGEIRESSHGGVSNSPLNPLDIQGLGGAYERLAGRQLVVAPNSTELGIVPLPQAGNKQSGNTAGDLSSQLESFILKPTVEEVFPSLKKTVEEYLMEAMEAATSSTTEANLRNNLRAFEERVLQYNTATSQHMRESFFSCLKSVAASRQYPPSERPLPLLLGPAPSQTPRAQGLLPPLKSLEEPVVRHARAVEDLLASLAEGNMLKAVVSLSEAHSKSFPEESSKKDTVQLSQIWKLVKAIAEEAQASPTAGDLGLGTVHLVRGSRRHLEEMYVEFMEKTVREAPDAAQSGGSTGNLNLVRSFLKVKLSDSSPLDISAPPGANGLDTTWDQIFYCLRAGFHQEALQVARSSPDSASYADMLAEWVQTQGCVSAQTSARAAALCAPLLTPAPTCARLRARLLCLALLAQGSQLAGSLLRVAPPLFPTIQDLCWVWLALVCRHLGLGGQAQGWAQGGAPARLADLQAYLGRYPPTFYTHGGGDPLMFSYVMLMSASPGKAVASLLETDRRSSTSAADISDPRKLPGSLHVGLALSCFDLLAQDGAGAAADVAEQARLWGALLAQQGKPDWGVAYCQAAAWALNPALNPEGRPDQLLQGLRRLLAEGGRDAQEYLLGADLDSREYRGGRLGALLGGAGGEVRAQVREAAEACRARGRHMEAVQLYERAFEFGEALGVLYEGFARALGGRAPSRRLPGGRQLEELMARARSLVGRLRGAMSDPEPHLHALATVDCQLAWYAMLRSSLPSAPAPPLDLLLSAPFLPLASRSPQYCTAFLASLPPPILSTVPPFLATVLKAISDVREKTEAHKKVFREIATFISKGNVCEWPPELKQMAASVV